MKKFAGFVVLFVSILVWAKAHTLTLGGKVVFNSDPTASGFAFGDTATVTYVTQSLSSETHMPGFNQWNYLSTLSMQIGPMSWVNLPVMLSLTDMGFATAMSATLTPAPAPGAFSLNQLGFLVGVNLDQGFFPAATPASAFSSANLALNFPSLSSTGSPLSVVKFDQVTITRQAHSVPDASATWLWVSASFGLLGWLARRQRG